MFLVVHLLRWSMKMIIVSVCKNAKLEFLLSCWLFKFIIVESFNLNLVKLF